MENTVAWATSWMLEQHGLDLRRGDLLAASVDDLLDPAVEEQVTGVVQTTLVPGTEPPV